MDKFDLEVENEKTSWAGVGMALTMVTTMCGVLMAILLVLAGRTERVPWVLGGTFLCAQAMVLCYRAVQREDGGE